MKATCLVILASIFIHNASGDKTTDIGMNLLSSLSGVKMGPCACGVFLSGQFNRGSSAQPKGNPVLLHEYPDSTPCSPLGQKQCINKCLEVLVKHLPNSPTIVCGSIDRDCHKERAYLFVKTCSDSWVNSNLSAGREFCCKDNVPYKCPVLS